MVGVILDFLRKYYGWFSIVVLNYFCHVHFMLKELPRFRNFTVDLRLKQFRCVRFRRLIIINFKSKEGISLLKEYLKEGGNENYKELKNII